MRYFLVGRAVGGLDVIPFTFVKQMAKQYLSVTYCCTLHDKHGLSHGMCLYQVMMSLYFFLNGVANDAESTQKSKITS